MERTPLPSLWQAEPAVAVVSHGFLVRGMPGERAQLAARMAPNAIGPADEALVPNGPAKDRPFVLPYGAQQFFIPGSAVVSYRKKANVLPDGEALGKVLASTDPERWMKHCHPDCLMKVKGKIQSGKETRGPPRQEQITSYKPPGARAVSVTEATSVYTTFSVEGHPDEARILRLIPVAIAERIFSDWKTEIHQRIESGEFSVNNRRQRNRLAVLDWTKAEDCPYSVQVSPFVSGWREVRSRVRTCNVHPIENKEKARQALTAFVRKYTFHKGETKPKKMFLPALLEATCAPEFEAHAGYSGVRLPLDANSSRADLTIAFEAWAEMLSSPWAVSAFHSAFRRERDDAASRLRYPSRALLDALAKELGAAGAVGGAAAVDGPEEEARARQRADIARLVIVPTDETGKSSCLLLLDLFVDIRGTNPDVSAACELEPQTPADQLSPSSA